MFCKSDSPKAKLSPCAVGVALGLIKGVYLLVLAWVGWLWGYGMPMISRVSEYFHAYDASFAGGLVGGLWGFICGLVFGVIFGILYNWCLRCCCRKCPEDEMRK